MAEKTAKTPSPPPTISPDTHGVLDYAIGLALILAPYFFGLPDRGAATTLFMLLGCAMLVYSLATRYLYSVAQWIPLRVHQALDIVVAATLILGPTIFGYSERIGGFIYTLHLVFGFGILAMALLTRGPRRADAKRAHEPIISLEERRRKEEDEQTGKAA